MGRGDGDFRELIRSGVGVDRAVAEDEDAILEAHQEDGGNLGKSGTGLDELEGRTDGVSRGVDGAADHAVGVSFLDHHGAEVGGIHHGIAGLFDGHALLLAVFIEGIGVVLEFGRRERIDDFRPADVEPHLRRGQCAVCSGGHVRADCTRT